MKITVKGTNLELTGAIKTYAEKKFQHLSHFLNDILLARLELEMFVVHHPKHKFRAEATIDVPGHVFRAESTENDLYAAIDTLLPKLISQFGKIKAKHSSRTKTVVRKIKENGFSENLD